MPRLSRAQETARRRVMLVAGSGLPPDRLASRLISAIERAIGFDGYRLFGIDPRTLLVNRLLAASDEDGWARLEWFREVYLASKPLTYVELPHLMRANLTAVAFQDRQDACWGYPPSALAVVPAGDHYRLFHEQRAPVGGSILASFRANGQWVAALQAYRRDPKRPFRAGDVSFLRLLAPTIGRAIAAALARERATPATAPVPEGSGILILDAAGEVRFATPAGDAWRSRLGALDRPAADPLPSAIRAAIARLRSGEDQAACALLAPSAAGFARVEASPADDAGGVAVVVSAARPLAAPVVPMDWPLTAQERRLVEEVARGRSNREVAAALHIGEQTVEWHMRRAYDKLGVSGRSRLIARLFQETLLPGLAEAPDGEVQEADDEVVRIAG